jgi:hypothetical protein
MHADGAHADHFDGTESWPAELAGGPCLMHALPGTALEHARQVARRARARRGS